MTAKHYAHYLGAPEFYALDEACRTIHDAFTPVGIFLVGSSLTRRDYHDVDVRCILDDEEFARMFPGASTSGGDWMKHARWAFLSSLISSWLAARTGLKIDFQFQSVSGANSAFDGPRNALGVGVTTRSALSE
jgi:hypothetical protein